MHKKRLMKICLASALAVSMVSGNVAPAMAADVSVAASVGDQFVTIEFKCGEEVVAEAKQYIVKGEYYEDYGNIVFDRSELKNHIPDGYELMDKGTGDIMAPAEGKLTLQLKKISGEEIGDFFVKVQFVCEGKNIGNAEDKVVSGTKRTDGPKVYTEFDASELEEYVPEGYILVPSGTLTVDEGETLTVEIALKDESVSIGDFFVKVRFMYDGQELSSVKEVPVNGQQITNTDHTYTVFDYKELEKYVPSGYQMLEPAEETVTVIDEEILDINVDLIEPSVSVGDFFVDIKFVYDGEEVDRKECVVNGTQTDNGQFIYTMFNLSEVEKYVPDGYVMTAEGDVTAYEGQTFEVNVVPQEASVSVGDFWVNIKFICNGSEIIPAKDYIVNGTQVNNGKYIYTMFNYSELEKYVPAGYVMTPSGDVTAYEGETLEVNLAERQIGSVINVRFVYNNKFIAGGDYRVDLDGDGIFAWSELNEYVPEGYKMLKWGSASVEDSPFVVFLTKKTNIVPGIPGIEKKNGWYKVGDSDWSYYIDNEKVVSDWISVEEADPYNGNKVGTVWYHMNSEGLMDRGWIVDESGWKVYLLDSNGRMMHSQWVNAPASEELKRPAGLYKLTADGAVQMNGWAASIDNENIEWFCNAGTGLFEVTNPDSWRAAAK